MILYCIYMFYKSTNVRFTLKLYKIQKPSWASTETCVDLPVVSPPLQKKPSLIEYDRHDILWHVITHIYPEPSQTSDVLKLASPPLIVRVSSFLSGSPASVSLGSDRGEKSCKHHFRIMEEKLTSIIDQVLICNQEKVSQFRALTHSHEQVENLYFCDSIQKLLKYETPKSGCKSEGIT